MLKPEWNVLLTRLIQLAGTQGLTAFQVKGLLFIPSVIGNHVGPGYRFVEEAGVSFQGQNARKAWEQAARIATEIGTKIEAKWEWYSNPKAIKPGEAGWMTLLGRT